MRDYFRPGGFRHVTLLADYHGDVESQGLGMRMGERVVRVNNDIVGKITGLPSQFRDNWRLLTDPAQRQLLARSLIDDSLMTHRRRRAIMSMLLWLTLLSWAVVGVVLAVVNREALGTYQSVYSLFFYSLATSLFLPTPFEILLGNAVTNIGVLWTIVVAAVGKTAGSWIVLMMGDKANEGLEALLEKYETLKRMFDGLVAFAQRYGYFAIFILFAIPFMPDTGPLFLLAVLRMRKSIFLAVTFLAIVVRSLLFIYTGSLFAAVPDLF